ncbi:MAG: acetate--CoA ligase [Pararhodobacter sp.]|nr:acetate--CoA ligase [Pararhodobacter sp.]
MSDQRAFPIIVKTKAARDAAADSPAARAAFSWVDARARLARLPGGGLNIAHEAVERHLPEHADQVAIRWLGRDDSRREITYGALAADAARFANVLAAHGVGRGDRLFTLMGRVPALYTATLGAFKAGLVVSPLFAAFGPEPVRARMEIGAASVLLTTAALYRRKVADWCNELPSLKLVLIVGGDAPEGCVALDPAMAAASDSFQTVATEAEDMALLHFTSGTTGKPKGVMHVHGAVVAHIESGRLALDMRPGDIYWCTADPGWVTGMSYGIIAPLANRVTMIVDEAEFDLERWYSILEREGVQIWYTAPTAIRMMMRAGKEAVAGHDLAALRFLASVGEPLNAECVVWGHEVFGHPFHDNWWQSETGGIMIANTPAMGIKPGSMGQPLPGIEAGVVAREDGTLREMGAGEIGELALRTGWPSMMRGYLHEEERYARCFADGWYLTGDLALRDSDGYYWFIGRADDLIKSSGHLIGPFEVESTLIEHEAVAEAAVIGIPDETAGEVVKAYVTLNSGFEADEETERAIRGHARKRLGPAVAPREIVFRKTLPKTRSGKIMRRLLKARELGLPEGDISTLESDET